MSSCMYIPLCTEGLTMEAACLGLHYKYGGGWKCLFFFIPYLQGDSGGPLICKIDERYKLIGVVSWGSDNCDPESPTVYTRISAYRDWISTITNGKL